MPFNPTDQTHPCTICTSGANVLRFDFRVGEIVDCTRCGDFIVST